MGRAGAGKADGGEGGEGLVRGGRGPARAGTGDVRVLEKECGVEQRWQGGEGEQW